MADPRGRCRAPRASSSRDPGRGRHNITRTQDVVRLSRHSAGRDVTAEMQNFGRDSFACLPRSRRCDHHRGAWAGPATHPLRPARIVPGSHFLLRTTVRFRCRLNLCDPGGWVRFGATLFTAIFWVAFRDTSPYVRKDHSRCGPGESSTVHLLAKCARLGLR
jgi:hypothetical protein